MTTHDLLELYYCRLLTLLYSYICLYLGQVYHEILSCNSNRTNQIFKLNFTQSLSIILFLEQLAVMLYRNIVSRDISKKLEYIGRKKKRKKKVQDKEGRKKQNKKEQLSACVSTTG